jgi:hypothetical protein
MFVVALAAVGLWGVRMWELSGEYARVAEQERSHEAEFLEDLVRAQYRCHDWDKFAELSAARAAYHTALVQKYERAARYPWLPVEPDPPEP